MKVLVINCGSSSIKMSVLDPKDPLPIMKIRVERVGTNACSYKVNRETSISLGSVDHREALQTILPKIKDDFELIVHRVVHGGALFSQPVQITDMVIEQIRELCPLAPLHNPANLAGIEATVAIFAQLPQVAVFDTAFHARMPRRSRAYALPKDLSKKHQLRRYGFHGPSHEWVSRRAAEYLEQELRDLRIISCHLGNGASVCAVEYGRSIETSMGMTPLEGLVMGTRSGDIDPGIIFELGKKEEYSLGDLERILNKESGLAGLSGTGNDMRDIAARAAEGNEDAQLAIHVFTHRLRKYIGAYAAIMGGVDAIIFTAGIGENSALIRHRVGQRLGFLGARLSEERNRDVSVDLENPIADISEQRSRVSILVVATDEERAMAQKAVSLIEQLQPKPNLRIPIAISARHVHLNKKALEALFGEGHALNVYKPISQPGQYACVEKVDLIGPRRTISGVRIIGPLRPKVQVEISRTDEFSLGIDAPVRNSGDVRNSPGITLRGPKGDYTIPEGVICARRHIHMRPEDAQAFGVSDRDVVEVAIDSSGRDLIFGDVLVRVSPRYALEMHIDTDEANAAQISPGFSGILAGVSQEAILRKKELRR